MLLDPIGTPDGEVHGSFSSCREQTSYEPQRKLLPFPVRKFSRVPVSSYQGEGTIYRIEVWGFFMMKSLIQRNT